MGRRTLVSGASRNIQPTFEVKLRESGDRIREDGRKTEGGRIFSRHMGANNYEHAKSRANDYAKKKGLKVVSIGIVHPEDVIGDHKLWGLEKLIGVPIGKERRRDAINENMTLDDIVFGKRNGRK